MLIKKIQVCFLLAIACIFISIPKSVYSADTADDNKFTPKIPYKLIDISALSRYSEDRIAFQHIQLPGFSKDQDNSIANLLIIKNEEIYLFRDGYDDPQKVMFKYNLQMIRGEEYKDLWTNKINSKPDYIRIASRKMEKLVNDKEDTNEKNAGDLYRSVRNSFLAYHVKVFRELMMNRMESDFKINRKPIFPPAFKEIDDNIKFSTEIKARAMNNYLYYAEDRDGDGITETFTVSLSDGFNWGYKSGPNIVFIYNNKEDDIKQIIGKLCHEAYFGIAEEEKEIMKLIPKDTDILNEFRLEKVTLQTPAKSAEPASDKK